MATIDEIRRRVDEVKPCRYDVVRWIGELDARIAINVMLMDISECEQFAYHRKPREQQGGIVPMLKFPHDEMYDLWLYAMIDAADGETELYQNDIQMFNAAWSDYVRWFASTYDPAGNGTATTTYYITAYALAVQQGFSGDMAAWLASLVGPTGKSAYEYAVEGGYEGTEEAYKKFMQSGVETDASFEKEGIPADAAALGRILNEIGGILNEIGEWNKKTSENVENIKQTAENAMPKSGGTMTGAIAMGGNKVTGLGTPTASGDAVPKAYADAIKAVPSCTASDNGKFLRVVSGVAAWQTVQAAEEVSV